MDRPDQAISRLDWDSDDWHNALMARGDSDYDGGAAERDWKTVRKWLNHLESEVERLREKIKKLEKERALHISKSERP